MTISTHITQSFDKTGSHSTGEQNLLLQGIETPACKRELTRPASGVGQRHQTQAGPRRTQRPACNAQLTFRPHKPDRKVNKGPCAVYLLVHAYAQRFKIGLSNDSWIRGQDLPEARVIRWDRSLQVMLPSRARAHQVESMLHRALASFRLNLTQAIGGGWDGSTEWFSLNALQHAINLLQVTPLDEGFSRATLVPADQRNFVAPGSEPPQAIKDVSRRPQDAGQFNLERIACIVELLYTLSWHYRVELVLRPVAGIPSLGKKGQTATLIVIHGLKNDSSEEVMRDRYRVMDTDFWAFRSNTVRTSRPAVPLIRIIHVLQQMPDAVILEVNDLQLIRRVPEGQHVIARWRDLCRKLKACEIDS